MIAGMDTEIKIIPENKWGCWKDPKRSNNLSRFTPVKDGLCLKLVLPP
jgi:hypothetical protein